MMKFCKKCGCDREHYADYKCKVCKAEYAKAYRIKNADRVHARQAAWDAANKERKVELRAKNYAANREAAAAYNRTYREQNREVMLQKEKLRRAITADQRAASKKAWAENNKHRILGYNRARSAVNKRAYCRWANQSKIKEIYSEAAALRDAGIDVHVDHVVPLKHPLVCGLHNEFNLQLLTGHENISKHNQFTINA